ncbi:MAG: dolichyl-phosphate beta-D-mannosyltransferase [Candidatus Buchananbacteria bacterium RIFCSPHIGHO2_02_FULL_45_11b]|uniref:Dolichyl-phosphate beta-D-mannosyltransferase n=2 Tax=Candidatus Buchananiibacteriota TaxID=1817903 RepID=A0A1G1YEM7_9BACT|nr:MAG: dolichyl-phosphate beta-D-mannosyltransferase [Candidatus Buchananbacteria bacterium RIFCSPHIGHO2_02_FULL_45_11b]OGY53490.1 MAG: dolichyl-phosphate beta-D-mannosyltransferase [Candidatus Buchananbacteria bacterium RIFCSPLOWO2_01_FULL_45_31]
MPKIYIIIPTYNEKNNIAKLLEQIFALDIPGLNVLIVDDNSPDGTGALIEKLKLGNLRLDILHRQKKSGLGPAYTAGFKEALRRGADLIFEMDADLSHNPKYLPDFLAAIKSADLVLGSRYIKGGGVSNWNWARRQISRFGNIYARLVLGLPFRDLTDGFKCYRREVLEKINLGDLNSVGYNFQIETTYKAYRAGFRVKEIPIVFTERAEGKSKFNVRIILESFWQVLLLRLKK